jgi:hypothetical protein
MHQNEEHNLPKIGYLYHYPRIDHSTDNFRLDIHITSEPTNQHFDVLRVQFRDGSLFRIIRVTLFGHLKNQAVVRAG